MSNQLKESITVDFTKGGFEKLSLFTGRKNGKKAKGSFNISISEKFIFLANLYLNRTVELFIFQSEVKYFQDLLVCLLICLVHFISVFDSSLIPF